MTTPAIQAYRQLLRAVNRTFKGDVAALELAYGEIRSQYESSRSLKDSVQISKKISDAHEARMFISENIVQAEKSSCGTVSLSPDNAKRLKELAPEEILGHGIK